MINHHYNKKLKPLARGHRNHSTKAEIRMWCELLRNKQMMVYPFLRQRPIEKYIADFFCKELNLVIELDGLTHQLEETMVKDKKKQQRLEELGYTVLRFPDREVMNNILGVYETIKEWIEGQTAVSSPA